MLHPKITKESSPSSREPARKRVARACDRCRLKKGKCDGKEQCAKCVSADVMCIYTDRKPPQHKLISPAVAEALQSENLTLKKATIIIFKQLMDARNGELPMIEGVDWASEKVANGKSGRALNYIISQEARVDNRISNEEITNYDSDTNMLDSSRTCPNSPASRQSSPQSTFEENAAVYWSSTGFEITQQQQQEHHSHTQHKKRKATKYGYPSVTDASVSPGISVSMLPPAAPFIDPGLLQPTGSIGSTYNHPPTPPTGLDNLDFLPRQMQWPNQQQQQQQQQQASFYDERFLAQRYVEEVQARGSADVPCGDSAMSWATSEFYPFLGDKEFGKVFESMTNGDVRMYDRNM